MTFPVHMRRDPCHIPAGSGITLLPSLGTGARPRTHTSRSPPPRLKLRAAARTARYRAKDKRARGPNRAPSLGHGAR